MQREQPSAIPAFAVVQQAVLDVGAQRPEMMLQHAAAAVRLLQHCALDAAASVAHYYGVQVGEGWPTLAWETRAAAWQRINEWRWEAEEEERYSCIEDGECRRNELAEEWGEMPAEPELVTFE